MSEATKRFKYIAPSWLVAFSDRCLLSSSLRDSQGSNVARCSPAVPAGRGGRYVDTGQETRASSAVDSRAYGWSGVRVSLVLGESSDCCWCCLCSSRTSAAHGVSPSLGRTLLVGLVRKGGRHPSGGLATRGGLPRTPVLASLRPELDGFFHGLHSVVA